MNLELNAIAIKTLVRKEMVRVMRIWVQTIVPPAITMTLYFIIFGNLIGRRIGTMDGFDYMQYIAPGLIMMSVITNSYGNVVSSFFGAKFGRHLEEMLVSPMSNSAIIIGHVAGGVPEFWQAVSKVNPILYMVNAFRYGILGTSDISIVHAYVILVAFVLLLFSGCLYLMNRGVGIRE